MKALISFAAVMITSLYTLSAQTDNTWPRPGAEWHYCQGTGYTGDESPIKYQYSYTNDTTIADMGYAVVKLTHKDDAPFTAAAGTEENYKLYFRSVGDTLYRWVNGQEYIFMIEGIEPGSNFTSFRSTFDNLNAYPCIEEVELTVTDASIQTIDGAQLRSVKLEEPEFYDIFDFETPSYPHPEYTFFEGVGLNLFGAYAWYDLFESWDGSGEIATCVFNGVSHAIAPELHLYRDDNMEIEFFSCVLSTRSFENKILGVFPNPARDQITLNLPSASTQLFDLSVFDLTGKVVLQQSTLSSGSILSVSDLKPGMYLLRASDNTNFYVSKLIVE